MKNQEDIDGKEEGRLGVVWLRNYPITLYSSAVNRTS